MSVEKTADNSNISVFTKDDVKVYKEQDILITCKGSPILIGIRDERGQYRIPLVQQHGQWQPRKPTKRARNFLQQANHVYNLPSTEEAVKWMHATCGYPMSEDDRASLHLPILRASTKRVGVVNGAAAKANQ